MHSIVPIIIIIIIFMQLFFFVKNFLRMRQFSNIFTGTTSWRIRRNAETSLVDGIYGDGNKIFIGIITSINKYLGNNSGSVIDFGLLKDAVDRHCDSVENDIATQTPIPLYWGLAGTMAGVIMGLWDLLQSNAIMTLMSSGGGVIDNASQSAASGINSLLSGVAWAMLASICGILLTTVNSLLFKRCKLNEEDGKNSFFAWMQSELLPELPSDTSEALNNLVRNLNKFNNTFAQNTSNLGNTLNAVNQSYAIQRFESLYNEQANRIHILEEIRDFFGRHKGEIAKTTADADRTLQESLQNIKESTSSNVEELHKRFIEQSESFKEILKSERESFEQFTNDLKAQFSAQMTQMPQLSEQLEEISAIPVRLDKLIEKIEMSNIRLANDISQSIKQTLMTTKVNKILDTNDSVRVGDSIPAWMKVSGWAALVIIAITCILNIVFMFFPVKKDKSQPQQIHIQPTELPMQIVNKQAENTTDAVLNTTDSIKDNNKK